MPTWRASNGSTPTWHFAEPRRHAETRGSAVAKVRAWRPRGRTTDVSMVAEGAIGVRWGARWYAAAEGECR